MAATLQKQSTEITMPSNSRKSSVVTARWLNWRKGSSKSEVLLDKQKPNADTPHLHHLVKKLQRSIGSKDYDESPEGLFSIIADNSLFMARKLFDQSPSMFLERNENGETLLHVAAKNGHNEMINFLVATVGLDINEADTVNWNTALHVAVQHSQLSTIDHLLTHGANACILNKRELSPLHLAVELNLINVLHKLLQYPQIDINIPGGNDAPPIHLAAANNFVECLQLLMDHGASSCKMNASGLRAIHLAAKAGAKDAIECIVQYSERQGYTRSNVMEMRDRDGNVPLHAAVDSGSSEVVKVCLDAGANIDAQQEDQSTPVHFACTRKELQILKLMFETQPEKKNLVLSIRDSNGRTPLMNAVALDHEDIVDYLLAEGAEKETQDLLDRTALLLAAASSAGHVLSLLIRRGANLFHRDIDERNFIHLAVINRTSFEHYLSVASDPCSNSVVAQALPVLLNERDKHGSTPLHYASGDGLLQTIEHLLVAGAEVTVRNNNRDTALHFAAKYGRYNSCCRLLDSPHGQLIINVQDRDGCSPMFVAAQNGHARTVNLLLANGALFHRNNAGLTVLHAAAMKGHRLTVDLLLKSNSSIIDAVAGCGNTALHIAAKFGHIDVVRVLMNRGAMFTLNNCFYSFFVTAIMYNQEETVKSILQHKRWKEAMHAYSAAHGPPMFILIEKMPQCALLVLDNCTRIINEGSTSNKKMIEYDLQFLEPPSKQRIADAEETGTPLGPLPALNLMVQHSRLQLLSHPCSQAVLKMKWENYGRITFGCKIISWISIVFAVTYLNISNEAFCEKDTLDYNLQMCNSFSSLSNESNNSSVLDNLPSKVLENGTLDSTFSDCLTMKQEIEIMCNSINPFRIIAVYFILLNNVVGFVLNIICLCKNPHDFLCDMPEMMVTRLLAFVLQWFFVVPFVVSCNYNVTTHYQAAIGIITMLLCWIQLFLLLQVAENFGLYVVMFLEIMKTLLKAALVFAILICGFGFTFHSLLRLSHEISRPSVAPGQEMMKSKNRPSTPGLVALAAFKTPAMSAFKALLMMTGELDFLDTFTMPLEDESPDTMHFPVLTFIILFIFVLFVPIIVMNLMLGLALGNIEAVQKSSELKKNCTQVKLLSNTEKHALFPFCRSENQSTTYRECPDKCKRITSQFFNYLWSLLPRKSLQKEDEKKPMNYYQQRFLRCRHMMEEEANKENESVGKFGKREIGMLLERQTQMLRSVMQQLNIGSADLEEMEDEMLVSYLGSRDAKKVKKFRNKVEETKLGLSVIKHWASVKQTHPPPFLKGTTIDSDTDNVVYHLSVG